MEEYDSESCERCGRLAMEGSNLCEKCVADDVAYEEWKQEFNHSHKELNDYE